MPSATTAKRTTVVLELNLDEAAYLRDLLQNYLGDDPQEEPVIHNRMRGEIFNTLKEACEG